MENGKIHRTAIGIERIDFLNMSNMSLRVERKLGLAAKQKRFSLNISGSAQAVESVRIQHIDEIFCVSQMKDADHLTVVIEISPLTALWISGGRSITAKMQPTISPLRISSHGKGATLSGLVFKEWQEDDELIVTVGSVWQPLHILIGADGYITIQRTR